MMTERQIEAAAQAIYEVSGWDRKWEEIMESGRERFREAARAAFDAAARVERGGKRDE